MPQNRGVASKSATALMFACAAAMLVVFPGAAEDRAHGALSVLGELPRPKPVFLRDSFRLSDAIQDRPLSHSDTPWTNIPIGSFRLGHRGFGERLAEQGVEIAGKAIRETPENIARELHSRLAPSRDAMRQMLLDAGFGRQIEYHPDLSGWWSGFAAEYWPNLAQSALSKAAELAEEEAIGRLGFIRTLELDVRGGFGGGRPTEAAVNLLGALHESDSGAALWQFRGFASSESDQGFNLGALYRTEGGDAAAMFGANVFLDFLSDSETGDFWRYSGGLEFRSAWVDAYVNQYFPITSPFTPSGSGDMAYTAGGRDFALRLHSPRVKWLAGALTHYQWSGEGGDGDESGLRYALEFRPPPDWGKSLLFELEYDQPEEGGGQLGGRLNYYHTIGEEDSQRLLSSEFHPRDYFYETARRDYSQRVRRAEGGRGGRAEIRVEEIAAARVELKAHTETVTIYRAGAEGEILFSQDGETRRESPGFSFRYLFPGNGAATLRLFGLGAAPRATLVFGNSDFVGMRGETEALLDAGGRRLEPQNADIHFHRSVGRFFRELSAEFSGGGATVALAESGVEFESRKFPGGDLTLTLLAGRVGVGAPSFSGGMSCVAGDGWQSRRAGGAFQTFCEGDIALESGGGRAEVRAPGGDFSLDGSAPRAFFPLVGGASARLMENSARNLGLVDGRSALPATLSAAGKIDGVYRLGDLRGRGAGRITVRVGELRFDGRRVACGGSDAEQYGAYLIVAGSACENLFRQFGGARRVVLDAGHMGVGFELAPVPGARAFTMRAGGGFSRLSGNRIEVRRPAVERTMFDATVESESVVGGFPFTIIVHFTVRAAPDMRPARMETAPDYTGSVHTVGALPRNARRGVYSLAEGAPANFSVDRESGAVSIRAKLEDGRDYFLTVRAAAMRENFAFATVRAELTVRALKRLPVFRRTVPPGFSGDASEFRIPGFANPKYLQTDSDGGLTLRGAYVSALSPLGAGEHGLRAEARDSGFVGPFALTASILADADGFRLAAENEKRLTTAADYRGLLHVIRESGPGIAAESCSPVFAPPEFSVSGCEVSAASPLSGGRVFTAEYEALGGPDDLRSGLSARVTLHVEALARVPAATVTADSGDHANLHRFSLPQFRNASFASAGGGGELGVAENGAVFGRGLAAGQTYHIYAGATAEGLLGTALFTLEVTVVEGFADNEVEKPGSGAIAAHDYDGVVAEFRARTAQTLTFRRLPARSEFILEALSPNSFALSTRGGLAGRARPYTARITATAESPGRASRAFVWEATVTALPARGVSVTLARGGQTGGLMTFRAEDGEAAGLEPLVFRRLPGGDHSMLDVSRGGEVRIIGTLAANGRHGVSAGATAGNLLGEMIFYATVHTGGQLVVNDVFDTTVFLATAAVGYAGPVHSAAPRLPDMRAECSQLGPSPMRLNGCDVLTDGAEFSPDILLLTADVRALRERDMARDNFRLVVGLDVLPLRSALWAAVDANHAGDILTLSARDYPPTLSHRKAGGGGVLAVGEDGGVYAAGALSPNQTYTLLAAASGDKLLGELLFTVLVSTNNEFGGDEISNLSHNVKTADGYNGVIAAISATTAGARVDYGAPLAAGKLTLRRVSASRLELIPSGGGLAGGGEYRLTATLTVWAAGYRSRAFTLLATVTALAKRAPHSRALNPGHPAERLATLRAAAPDALNLPLAFEHLGDGAMVTIESGGEASLLSPAIAGAEAVVSASAVSDEFLGELLFTVSVTVRKDSSLALDAKRLTAAPDYVGHAHRAAAVNAPQGAVATYRLVADSSGRFEMFGDSLRATLGLLAGADYTVTIAARTSAAGLHAAGYAEAAIEVTALTARGLSAAAVNPDYRDVALTFRDADVSGLTFSYAAGDAGVTVLRDGKVSLSSPAVAGSEMTVLAGATGDYLGTLYFSASITVRKAFGDGAVAGLSPDIKVADGYGGVLSTLEGQVAGAVLSFGNPHAGVELTLVSLADNRVALSVAGGGLAGGAEYALTATLTVSAAGYQSRAFTLLAAVTALAKRGLYSRKLNPGHPAEELATLRAAAPDALNTPLAFEHLGDGAVLTVGAGGQVALLSPAASGAEVVVSASAVSDEFLGAMLFTASVTVRAETFLGLDGGKHRAAPDYVGRVHMAAATAVPDGAAAAYDLIADSSGRFEMRGSALRAALALAGGSDYTVTIEARTDETATHSAGFATATVEVSALTARGLSAAAVNPDYRDVALTFGDADVSGLTFSYAAGDAGVTVLPGGEVSLSSPAVAGAEMTVLAGATGDYLGTLYFSASITVRKAFGDGAVAGLSPDIKVADGYGGVLSTLEGQVAGAVLSFGNLHAGAELTLAALADNRVALSVAGSGLAGGAEYVLTATLTASAAEHQPRAFTLFATVTALARRSLRSRVLNPGHPAEGLVTLSAIATDGLADPLFFAHLGEGATLTIHSGGVVSLLSPAVAGAEAVVSASAVSDEFLGELLFTVSVTVRKDSSLALDAKRLTAAPDYVGHAHRAAAVNAPQGAVATYRLVADSSGRFGMFGDSLRATLGLLAGADYTVTIAARTSAAGLHAAGYAEAAIEVTALTARGLSAAAVDPGRRDVALTFRDADVFGLTFSYAAGDAGVTVLRDGKVSLSSPAVAGSEMTVLAGATGDYLGTLYFSASITVRKAFGDGAVAGLSPDIKVADGYGGVLSTLEAAGAALSFGNLHAGAELTLVSLADDRVALSVAGSGLAGGAEYALTATLTASAAEHQPRAFTLFATVTALAQRDLYSRRLNPGHPAEALSTLSAVAADNLLNPLSFAHLGEGATLTIHSGGEVSLRSPAIAGAEAVVSASAVSDEFLGAMLFTASVTVRAETFLGLDGGQYRAAPDYVGRVHMATATAVPDGAAAAYDLIADSSGRFEMRGSALRAALALAGGLNYTVTIEARTDETAGHSAGFATATVEVSALTARGLSAAAVNPDYRDVALTFGDADVSGLTFSYAAGDAGVTVLSGGEVSLSSPAVAGAEMTVLAGATGDYLGTLYFSASITVRKAFGDGAIAGLSPDIKVADGYSGVLSTLEGQVAGATLSFGNQHAGAELTLVSLADDRVALSVAGGGLAGGAEYALTATLTASAAEYQPRAFTLFATVTALAQRGLYSRKLNPGHPAEALSTLSAVAADNLLNPLSFAHLGEGATVTIHSGGEVSLRSPAVAGAEAVVSAAAISDEFLGAMLFTASVTVRAETSLGLDGGQYRAAPDYVGRVHVAAATAVPDGAAAAYDLIADASGRFEMRGSALRAALALAGGSDYTVTIEARTDETATHSAGFATATVGIAALTARGLSAAAVNPDYRDVALTFGDADVSGLTFSYAAGDAGVTVLSGGEVSLSSPAVAGAEMTVLARATGDYLGTLYFSASITVRKAFGDGAVAGLSPDIKVADGYGGVLSTLEGQVAGATLSFGNLHAGAELTLVSLADDRVALSVAGSGLAGGAEYVLTATLTASAAGHQPRAFTLFATVTALARRSLRSRVLNPGHPAEGLVTLSAIATDGLADPLFFAHMGEGATLTIHSGGVASLLSPAVAGAEAVVSASAISDEFLGEMLFTVSVTVRKDSSLALDAKRLTAAPGYVGHAHRAAAVNAPQGAVATYRLAADSSGRFGMFGDSLRATLGLLAGADYTVTIEARTSAAGLHAAGYAEAAIEVTALTARGLSAAAVNPDYRDVALTFRGDEVSGLTFAHAAGDAGVTVLRDGKVSLSSPAVAGSSMTVLAGATGDYLGTLYFSASITVRKAFGDGAVAGLSPDIKVADGYGGVLSTLEGQVAGATLSFGNPHAGAELTVVSLADNRVALSVAGGGLAGGAEYALTATLTASAAEYQPRAFTLFATVTALAQRDLYSRRLNPGHPAEALSTLSAVAADNLLNPLSFAHLGEGATVTIYSGGEVSLRSPAVAGTEAVVSASAFSDEFLGAMLFTASVTVRAETFLGLGGGKHRAAPDYVGRVHVAAATAVPDGAAAAYDLIADSSGRFEVRGSALRAALALAGGSDYTVTIGARTDETAGHLAGFATATVEVSALTARGLSAAAVNPDYRGVALAFGDADVSGLTFSYAAGDAGVTVLRGGEVSLSSPAVAAAAGSFMTVLAGATGDYLGTLYFSASITVRKAFGDGAVAGLSPDIKVADGYGGVLSTLEGQVAGATLSFGNPHAGAELTLVSLADNRVALSVAGSGLAGGAEYVLTATLTASAAEHQSRAFTLLATVTALAQRDLYLRVLNPGHPAGALTVLSTILADELSASLVFAHLGEGATVTIDAGGEVALLAPAVAGGGAEVSAAAVRKIFWG